MSRSSTSFAPTKSVRLCHIPSKSGLCLRYFIHSSGIQKVRPNSQSHGHGNGGSPSFHLTASHLHASSSCLTKLFLVCYCCVLATMMCSLIWLILLRCLSWLSLTVSLINYILPVGLPRQLRLRARPRKCIREPALVLDLRQCWEIDWLIEECIRRNLQRNR